MNGSPQEQAASFVQTFNNVILEPFIYLLMAVAFLVFVWGVVQYVFNAASDGGRETGRRHMIYGLIGLFIMISAWSILSIAAGTFGLDDELDCARTPTASGCF
jgi:phosphotransferase system  glucose/maltose/N-acetylglucosamine-specific IIC component